MKVISLSIAVLALLLVPAAAHAGGSFWNCSATTDWHHDPFDPQDPGGEGNCTVQTDPELPGTYNASAEFEVSSREACSEAAQQVNTQSSCLTAVSCSFSATCNASNDDCYNDGLCFATTGQFTPICPAGVTEVPRAAYGDYAVALEHARKTGDRHVVEFVRSTPEFAALYLLYQPGTWNRLSVWLEGVRARYGVLAAPERESLSGREE